MVVLSVIPFLGLAQFLFCMGACAAILCVSSIQHAAGWCPTLFFSPGKSPINRLAQTDCAYANPLDCLLGLCSRQASLFHLTRLLRTITQQQQVSTHGVCFY